MPFENARQSIDLYNQFAVHYNLIADAVYGHREKLGGPFHPDFQRYLIAALLAFDMGRMLGSGPRLRYDPEAGGFAKRLHDAMLEVQPLLQPLALQRIAEADLDAHGQAIKDAYRVFAETLGIDQQFHVGATKILHFLNPELFLIIDSNAARFLKREFDIGYRRHSPYGYSADRYLEAMKAVKLEIGEFGIGDFADLEPDTPMLRIFDKIAFATEGLEP